MQVLHEREGGWNGLDEEDCSHSAPRCGMRQVFEDWQVNYFGKKQNQGVIISPKDEQLIAARIVPGK